MYFCFSHDHLRFAFTWTSSISISMMNYGYSESFQASVLSSGIQVYRLIQEKASLHGSRSKEGEEDLGPTQLVHERGVCSHALHPPHSGFQAGWVAAASKREEQTKKRRSRGEDHRESRNFPEVPAAVINSRTLELLNCSRESLLQVRKPWSCRDNNVVYQLQCGLCMPQQQQQPSMHSAPNTPGGPGT